MTPTIATTLGALAQAEPALATLCAITLPAKSAYHLMKLARLVAQETTCFHEPRAGYLKELGTLNAAGTEYTFTPETAAEFNRRIVELSAVPIEIPWGPITLALLGDAAVAPADLLALGPLFAEADV